MIRWLLLGLIVTACSPVEAQFRRQTRSVDPLIRALDADDNGEISAVEMAAAPRRLKRLDRNGDGSVTPDEYRMALRRMFGSGNRSSRSGPGRSGAGALNSAGLKVGDALPDVVAVNEKGGPFRLADVKGKYSVIVFGCLT